MQRHLAVDPATNEGEAVAKSTIGPLDITFTTTMGRVREGDTWICGQMTDSATVFGT
jgi:hypothetical protein